MIAADSQHVGSALQVYDTWTGQLQVALKGHFDKVNCCVFHPWEQVGTNLGRGGRE